MKKTRRQKRSEELPAVPALKPGDAPDRWWWHAVAVLGLLLANLGLYHGALGLDFLSVDDSDYVLNNPYIANFSAANLKHIFTVPYAANYAPAHLLSYALDIALAGGIKSAFAMHLSNVMWHGFVVCMVYLLAFTLRAEIITATIAALLFLLHPAHVEVVAWISSRKDLIATGFAMLAMVLYLLNRRAPRKRSWFYVGSLSCFLAASAGKQSVILLPVVMLLWDLLVEKRRTWQMFADKIPFGLITVFFGWMTWNAQPSTNTAAHAFVYASTELTNLWLLTGFGDYVMYRNAPNATAWSQGVRALALVAAWLVWFLPLLLVRSRHPLRAALCCWVLVQMIPPMVLNFIVPITDRYLFLPSVGVCLLLADLLDGLRQRRPNARWLGWLLLAGLAAVWSAKTWNYVNEWRDPRSVWYGAHLKTQSPQVAQFLAEVYHNAGDRVDGFIKTGKPTAVTNELPLAVAVLGDGTSAEPLRAEWLGIVPTRTNSLAYRDRLWNFAWEQYTAARLHRGTLSMPNLFMNRGRLLVSQGKTTDALPEFQAALEFARHSTYEVIRQESVTHALQAIGVAHWRLRNFKEAESWMLQAQAHQRKSGQKWIPDLDQQVERIQALAASQP